jgi:hypothetical protein
MSILDVTLPTPRLAEIDSIELALPIDRAWEVLRHLDLARSPIARMLFALRTLPMRLAGRPADAPHFGLDDLRSSAETPGFQVLADSPPHEVVIGAIGKVWHLDIPFVHVVDAAAFTAFRDPGFVKVAWAIQLQPLGFEATRAAVEVRVDATDEASWKKFRRYFRIIGPGSHFIRRSLLSRLAREHGTPTSKENVRRLAGDDLLPDATEQVTQSITIAAKPQDVWPWLMQMGCRRAGFYSIDAFDNGGRRSAREIHPELQNLLVGEVIAATPEDDEGFEVLRIEPNRALVLGGLYDPTTTKQLPFTAARPEHFWHVTWAFDLEPLDPSTTRLHARGRAAFPESGRFHAVWIRGVHWLMQDAQLRHLAARVEGRLPRDDARDVLESIGGVGVMTAALLSPFLRTARGHWGVDAATAARTFPGDDLVPEPRWSWTHGVEVDAPAEIVWPWVAQIGADRGGFYSYQWLENLAGCALHNAETIHPQWRAREGDALRLHPKIALVVREAMPGRWFVAHAPADETSRAAGGSWATATWLFFVEPIDPQRSRFISRYRCACSGDLATRLQFGPTLLEPIGFAMDRRMLLGVKARAETSGRDS